VKSGQPWKIFHHAFSTKRDLLPALRGVAAALNAKQHPNQRVRATLSEI
jgi:hypothetical protein